MTIAYPYYGDDELDKKDLPTLEKITQEFCDHIEAGLIVADDNGSLELMEFVYCPVCGEKL